MDGTYFRQRKAVSEDPGGASNAPTLVPGKFDLVVRTRPVIADSRGGHSKRLQATNEKMSMRHYVGWN